MTASVLISAFVTLLVTIGPFETAPVFAGLTRAMSVGERTRTARRAVIIAGLVLFGFALGGKTLLAALHVSLPAMKTAGGVLLMLEAINLMFANPHLSSLTDQERAEAAQPRDISVFPLAFPLIAGPGSLVAVLLLMSQANGNPLYMGAILGVLAVCLVITFLAFYLAQQLMRLLGVTGCDVLGRISGLLLAAMAMQFIFDGLQQGLLQGLLRAV